MVNLFFEKVFDWAKTNTNIDCVLLVGSYARGTNKPKSDIDLCIVCKNKQKTLNNLDFIELFGIVKNQQLEYYGNCTSVRVWYDNGLEVEFGIVASSWLNKPLDAGTKRVLDDGFKIIVDKKGYFD